MKNKKNKKMIINIIIFIVLIILTFYLILKNQDVTNILDIINNVNKNFIVLAIMAMSIYVICEAININRILKGMGEEVTIFRSIKYTLILFFFSAITPAASGGQPMCIYYMHRDNISIAHATLVLLIQLSCFQIISLILGIIGAIVNLEILKSGIIYLFVIGILLNLTSLLLLIIGIFSKKMSEVIIKFSLRILGFFRIKNIEEKKEKLKQELLSYQESAMYIKENKKIIIKTILITLIQLLIYYSVPYWIYLSFGFNKYNAIQIILLQALLYTIVSCIPSPGSVGVSEGGFLGIYRNVFSIEIISSAMLLSRGVDFYLLIIVSVIVLICTTLKDKKKKH